MARLDRLGSAKEVAQIGAAIGREFSHALLAAVARKPEAELGSALDRLVAAGLLFRQGVPPHATYLFKHALVQDAAYGTLLREPQTRASRPYRRSTRKPIPRDRREPARTVGASLHRGWNDREGRGPLGQSRTAVAGALGPCRSRRTTHARTRPDSDVAPTPALRREQIKLQVALITPLIHVKGYAAPETKAAAERARLLIEQAEALGEPPEDPLLLFSVLYGFLCRELCGV